MNNLKKCEIIFFAFFNESRMLKLTYLYKLSRFNLEMSPYQINPINSVTLINPISDRWINSQQIKTLYEEDQLTQEEYILLDYLGAIDEMKDGEFTISFQGLKRKIDLHQARLTKALKRLSEKDLITKTNNGYSLTSSGGMLAHELMKKFGRQSTLESEIHSYIARGNIKGFPMTTSDREKVANAISGKWFGEFRFIAKSDTDDGVFEIEWISTNGSVGAKLIIGPENDLTVIISSAKIINSEIDLQLMMERISVIIENVLDSSIQFEERETYINRSRVVEDETPSVFAS